jgi:hypothetical protein
LVAEKGSDDNADDNKNNDKPVSLNKEPVIADNLDILDQIKLENEPLIHAELSNLACEGYQ